MIKLLSKGADLRNIWPLYMGGPQLNGGVSRAGGSEPQESKPGTKFFEGGRLKGRGGTRDTLSRQRRERDRDAISSNSRKM